MNMAEIYGSNLRRAPVVPAQPPATGAHLARVKGWLDHWAEWMLQDSNITRDYPRQCIGAPDARIHSVEDMEIEADKRTVRAVHTAVYELPVLQREAVLLHYGLQKARAWRADFDAQFEQAVEALHGILKNRIAC
jgi:hypothetical protein